MLIPVDLLSGILGIRPKGVLHVGAHRAEELDAYRRAGWAPRTWVEALPDLAASLRSALEDSEEDCVVEGAAWSESGLIQAMNRASNDGSSSLLLPTGHLDSHPEITFETRLAVRTITLDDVIIASDVASGPPEFLNLDIQGAELEALTGLSDWRGVHWIHTEISTRELYLDSAVVGDLDEFLRERGFRRVATVVLPHFGWGDALYVERGAWRRTASRRRLALRARVLWINIRIRGSLMKSRLVV